jgi:hypothetical protein
MTKQDIITLAKKDTWMMDILQIVNKLNLPDWWIGAGFIRSKVWDTLHGYKQRTPLPDIDIIYLDKNDYTKNEAQQDTTKQEIEYEKILTEQFPTINWSVTNQARMHLFHNNEPYKTSEDALTHWVETATCIGVKLDANNNVILSTPRGIEDLVNLVLRPTPGVYKDLSTFNKRIENKEWLKKWPKLKIIANSNA